MRPPLDLRAGAYFSNGAYGRSWGVREVLELGMDGETGQETVRFRGMAGTCRRKQGVCTSEEFLTWARYEVALNENSWQRVGYFEEEWPEVEE
jgi:hypothetical protein